MTTIEDLSAGKVLATIEADTSTSDWTTRVVLKKMGIAVNNRNRKTCRQALYGLWESGQIKKKPAVQGSDLVVYCSNSA